MDVGVEKDPVIDPEVKAFIFSLVSALGGSSAYDDGRYILGDDALAVLKDIKRWLRLYDDKTNRLDVSRLLAEANLVKGDLLEILASWREDTPVGSFRSKIALICVDLLTQLTWPVEKDEKRTQMHHFLHIPYLQQAQASYKQAILHHEAANILKTVIRVALPAMAQSKNERSPTEENIIKVVLYFFRNMAMITQPEGQQSFGEEEDEISRSATIDSFHSQDIFSLFLTVSSSMLDEFPTHDVEALDVLFHLVKGVDVERLFMEKDELVSRDTQTLQDLVSKEKSMLASYARYAPSRHNRFGTMLWIKRNGERYSTVFGQGSLVNAELSMAEMDKSKKWKRPRRPNKDVPIQAHEEFDTKVPLTASARRHLRRFVEQFLDSSFNPLFTSVRRSIEREAERVLETNTRQYLYLVSWFLQAECARRRKNKAERSVNPHATGNEVESFSLVASVLNQETFVLLNRTMQNALDRKEWSDLNAGMKCFSQILLTVQEMSESPLDEDQEIAENILNRIFYEQTTHDRIIALLRSYKDQGFGYLDACTELSHVFLRLLERYSKQNVDMQVRSRRRARRNKQPKEQPENEGEHAENDRELEAEDVAEAQRTTNERKFDFTRFAAKFINQGSVDTYVAFLQHYSDLSVEQLKRAHRFFYRTAFKMELDVFLFRLDIIMLLNKMVKGPEGLSDDNIMFKEWEELARQVFRRLMKKLEERPALGVELLFSKIKNTMFYLEYGYDKEPPKKIYRPPAELEVKPGLARDDQIGVAVSVMINQSKFYLLSWIKELLDKVAMDRESWEDEEQKRRQEEYLSVSEWPAVVGSVERDGDEETPVIAGGQEQPRREPPSIPIEADGQTERNAIQHDKHLRLLMAVLGFQRILGEGEGNIEEENATWTVPSSFGWSSAQYCRNLIQKLEFDPPTYEEGKTAEDFIRRKTSGAAQNSSDHQNESDSEGASGSELDRELFAPGGPTVRQSSKSPETKKKRRLRKHHAPDELLDDRMLEERRQARRKAEAEKLKKIKSTLYVHDSDDESDAERDREFFSKEEERRVNVGRGVVEAMRKTKGIADEREKGEERQSTKTKKRKSSNALSDEDEVSSTASQGGLSEASNSDVERSDEPASKRRKQDNGPTGLGISFGDDAMEYTGMDEGLASDSGDQSVSSHVSQEQQDSGPILGDTSDSEADTDTEMPQSSQQTSSGHGQVAVLEDKNEAEPYVEDGLAVEDRLGDLSVDEDSDKENAVTRGPMKGRRNVRAGFVVDSDSDE